jgi:hypothetical protein
MTNLSARACTSSTNTEIGAVNVYAGAPFAVVVLQAFDIHLDFAPTDLSVSANV